MHDSCDMVKHLNKLTLKNINRLIIGNLNINSLPDKFDQLELPVKNKVDKGAYIKYVGGGGGRRVLQLFQKNIL